MPQMYAIKRADGRDTTAMPGAQVMQAANKCCRRWDHGQPNCLNWMLKQTREYTGAGIVSLPRRLSQTGGFRLCTGVSLVSPPRPEYLTNGYGNPAVARLPAITSRYKP